MAEITTHRVERKPPRSSTTRLITDEDVKSKAGELEVVKASEAAPPKTAAPPAYPASRYGRADSANAKE